MWGEVVTPRECPRREFGFCLLAHCLYCEFFRLPVGVERLRILPTIFHMVVVVVALATVMGVQKWTLRVSVLCVCLFAQERMHVVCLITPGVSAL